MQSLSYQPSRAEAPSHYVCTSPANPQMQGYAARGGGGGVG